MGEKNKGSKDSFSYNSKHGNNGSKCYGINDVCGKLFMKLEAIVSIVSLRYHEIKEGGDKPYIGDKESIDVFIDMNETSEVVALKTNFVLHTIIIDVGECAWRTITISTCLKTISKRTCASLTNHMAIGSANTIELHGDCDIITYDYTIIHHASVGWMARTWGWEENFDLKPSTNVEMVVPYGDIQITTGGIHHYKEDYLNLYGVIESTPSARGEHYLANSCDEAVTAIGTITP